jgi:hypothetical protein
MLCPLRNPTQAGSLCYATLHPRVVAVGARNSRQEAIRDIARHSGEQCSIGFQPVSGFGAETGLIPTALSGCEPSQTALIFAPRVETG